MTKLSSEVNPLAFDILSTGSLSLNRRKQLSELAVGCYFVGLKKFCIHSGGKKPTKKPVKLSKKLNFVARAVSGPQPATRSIFGATVSRLGFQTCAAAGQCGVAQFAPQKFCALEASKSNPFSTPTQKTEA
jgi:hypothetical protein